MILAINGEPLRAKELKNQLGFGMDHGNVRGRGEVSGETKPSEKSGGGGGLASPQPLPLRRPYTGMITLQARTSSSLVAVLFMSYAVLQ